MAFPGRSRNWKRYQPADLAGALRACKEFARDKKNLSVERIAELMGVSVEALYKWMADGSMPAKRLASFEHICGAHFATEYLAGGAGRIVIRLPSGAPTHPEDLAALQSELADAVARLIRCYRENDRVEDTRNAITGSLRSLAWHRENLARMESPELDFGDGDD